MTTRTVAAFFTFCDLCNLRDAAHSTAFPHGFFNSYGLSPPYPGLFCGDEAGARNHGWEERDYGLICTDCVAKEREQEKLDEEQEAASGDLSLLAEILGLEKKEADRSPSTLHTEREDNESTAS
jgi:hypothetical protein